MTFTPPENRRDISALLEIMAQLRNPEGGCPWDVEQDYASIAPYTIEEAYEVADAIERGNLADLREELGDLLLQVVFHAQMASEENTFTFADVVEAICDKMVRRHPHVYDRADSRDSEGQIAAWEEIKAAERAEKGGKAGLLDDVPTGLPGMTRAIKLQKRAARTGFDWPDTDGVLDKLREECAELADARDRCDNDDIEAEFGDILFTVANLARHMKVDPEKALRRTNEKFCSRFAAMEKAAETVGKPLNVYSLEELEALWQSAK